MSIKGIVLGILVVLIIDTILGILLIPLFSDNMSVEALKSLESDTHALLFALVFGTLSTTVGGYIAARVGKDAIYLNSGMIGVIGIGIGFLVDGQYPLWFSVLTYISILPSALLGGYLFSQRQISYA